MSNCVFVGDRVFATAKGNVCVAAVSVQSLLLSWLQPVSQTSRFVDVLYKLMTMSVCKGSTAVSPLSVP